METKGDYGLKLSKGVDLLDERDGIFIKDLEKGDIITIQTNHIYKFFFLDSEGHAIVTSNGPHIRQLVQKRVSGATLGGSMIKTDWILLGCRLEIQGIKVLTLSRVRSISIYLNKKPMMFLQKTIH